MFSLFFLPSVMCGLLQVFVGDRREEHELRRGLAVVLGRGRLGDEVVEVLLELGQALRPGERLVEAEAAMRTSGFSSSSVWPWSLKSCERGRERQLVGRPAEVVDDQLQLGEAAVEQGLEVAEILHPLGQRVADEDDVVPLVKFQLRLVVGAAKQRRKTMLTSMKKMIRRKRDRIVMARGGNEWKTSNSPVWRFRWETPIVACYDAAFNGRARPIWLDGCLVA